MKNHFSTIISVALVFLLLPYTTAAQDAIPPAEIPSFPSCSAPTGTIIANHTEGVHGIVGDFGVYTGSDAVYSLANSNAVQCFCPTNGGAGIQTNWLNVSAFSAEDIALFTSTGWTYVVSGIVWGLSDNPYVAKNSSFTCSAVGGGESSIGSYGAGGGSEGQVLGTSTSNKKNKTSVLVVKPKVAGAKIAVLPATGSPYILFIAACLSVVATAIAIRV